MSQIKCIHCDGLGYVYNVATFQSEYCPHCEGKGYVEVSHDLGGPIETPVVEPVVEATAPKTTKKITKAKLSDVPLAETPISGLDLSNFETPVEPQADVDGSKN